MVTDKTKFVAALGILLFARAAQADDTNLALGTACKFFSSEEVKGFGASKLTDGEGSGTGYRSKSFPANTTATVYVPTGDAAAMIESGTATARAEGVKFLRTEDGRAVFEVGAGIYRFESRLSTRIKQGP